MVVLLSGVFFVALASGGDDPVRLPEPPHPSVFRALIESLGDDSIPAREDASARLRAAGPPAWPALEAAAANHADAEVRARSRDILTFSRLRRRLSFRVLDAHPSAPLTLSSGSAEAKIALIATFARHYEESYDFLKGLLNDRDPLVVLAAAEALYRNRNHEWIARLLDLMAIEDFPRERRVHDLLAIRASEIPMGEFRSRFERSGPGGRMRFMALALQAGLPLDVSEGMLKEMLRGELRPGRQAAMAWIRDHAVVSLAPDVKGLLDDGDPVTARDALATLRHLTVSPGARRLVELLRHPHPAVRAEAVRTAAEFGESECAAALRKLLRDESGDVRFAAVDATFKLRGPASHEDLLDVYLRGADRVAKRAGDLLTRRESRGWTILRARRLTLEEDSLRRRRGGELLLRIEGPVSLRQLASDPDPLIRAWVLRQWSRLLSQGALGEIERMTTDPFPAIRCEAIRTLVHRGKTEHLPALREYLTHKEHEVRYGVAKTLLAQGDGEAAALALRLVSGPDPSMRRLGLAGLARMGDARGAEQAAVFLDSRDGLLRRSAAAYLDRIRAGDRPVLAARLAATLERRDDDSLKGVFTLVVAHGGPSAAGPVGNLIRTGRAPDPEVAVAAVARWTPANLPALLGDDVTVNEIVFGAIRRSGKDRAVGLGEAIRRLCASPIHEVRRSAVWAAAEFGPPGIPAERINDPQSSVRHAAVGACMRAGLSSSAPLIAGRLNDEDPAVRVIAVLSLAKLRPELLPALRARAEREDCAWARDRMTFGLGINPKSETRNPK